MMALSGPIIPLSVLDHLVSSHGPLFSSSGSLRQHTPIEPLLDSLCIDTSVCNRFLFPRTKHTLSSLGSCVGVKHPCVDLSLPPVGPTFRCGLGWSASHGAHTGPD